MKNFNRMQVLIIASALIFVPALLLRGLEKKIPDDLLKTAEIDEGLYGSGEVSGQGKTYYLSTKGNDASDGLTWKTSWKHLGRSVKELKPGDTLLIEEGEYNEQDIVISSSGEKGRPVTISAAPGHRVLINSAQYLSPLAKTENRNFTYQVSHTLHRDPYLPTVEITGFWEEPSFIKLENAGSEERVDELPGTFYYDENQGIIYVHFTNNMGPGKNRLAVISRPVVTGVSHGRRDIYKKGRGGVEVTGNYICIKGINFRHGFAGLVLYDGGHNTVEDSSFFATELAGLILWRNTKWNLIKNNYGIRNGLRGGILIDKTGGTRNADSDNLIIGNRIDSSASTLRTAGVPVYGAIRTYGWPGPRNHIINNIMNDPDSSTFLGRGVPVESIFEGNVVIGSYSALNWHGKFAEDGSERIVVRNNTVTGTMGTQGLSSVPADTNENVINHDIAFINNIVLKNDAGKTEETGFADPSYLDYRLQGNSPFASIPGRKGKRGAFHKQDESIYYVSPAGKDEAPGISAKEPLGSLAAAAGKMKNGDTLYVMPGIYRETLTVNVSGTPGKPVIVRAYMKEPVVLDGIRINGSNIILEGFTVKGNPGDAVTIRGSGVTVKRCLIESSTGSGIRGVSAKNLYISRCTLVNNTRAIYIEGDSAGAAARDNLFSGNVENIAFSSTGKKESFLSSHNAYHIPDGNNGTVTEWGSVSGDMRFVNPGSMDYRVWFDSPASFNGIYAGTAGAFESVPRPHPIEDIRVTALKDSSATVAWNTPLDDTAGRVHYRQAGASGWAFVSDNEYGTVHAAGLTGLKAGTSYEFKIETIGRRGGRFESGALSFVTKKVPSEPSLFYVSPGGVDSNTGTSPENPWKTIRKANIEAGPGDTVYVFPGEYFHAISPISSGHKDSRITYRKLGEGPVVINGMHSIMPLISLTSKRYITVDGFTFTGAPDLAEGVLGISSSSDIEILNCRFGYGEPMKGAFIKGGFVKSASNLRIEGNVFWGARYHLEVWGDSPGLVIRNNTFARGDVCSVRIHGDIDAKIFNNIFYYPTTQVSNAALLTGLLKKENLMSDHNLFFFNRRSEDNTQIGMIMELEGRKSSNLAEQREYAGSDKNSIIADPMFADPEKGDFRLRSGSPALGKGQSGENIGACGPAI